MKLKNICAAVLSLFVAITFAADENNEPRLFLIGDGYAINGKPWVDKLDEHLLPGLTYTYIPFDSPGKTVKSSKWKEFIAGVRPTDCIAAIFNRPDGNGRDLISADLKKTGMNRSRYTLLTCDEPSYPASSVVGAAERLLGAAKTPEEKVRAFLGAHAITAAHPGSLFFRRESLTRGLRQGRSRPAVLPVEKGELRLTPTFCSCSVDYGAELDKSFVFEWRKADSEIWHKIDAMPHFEEFNEYRGSLMYLSEATDYEVRVRRGKETVSSGKFRTWATQVNIARTVMIDPAKTDFPIVISDVGTPDGWICYKVKGSVLPNKSGNVSIKVREASYVILDGIVFDGAGRHAIEVRESTGVRIVNCEFRHWGREGVRDFPKYRGQYVTLTGEFRDFDSAIDIARKSSEIVIERCWFHDPVSRANSWYYAHPAGPQAVTLRSPDHSTVIRWCDMTGSDEHPWNDAVESGGNFDDNGGFNRDADVYGNFMTCSNDDSIELDGGMRNVRCFGNRFEDSGCGVSIQGCMVSPVYVVDNLFTGLGDEHGIAMQTIKTSSFDRIFNGSWCRISRNIFWGDGEGITVLFPQGDIRREKDMTAYGLPRYTIMDNVFCGIQQLRGTQNPLASVRGSESCWSNNSHSVEIAEKDLDGTYPRRPLPFVLDRVRLSGIKVSGGAVSPQQFKIKVKDLGKRGARRFTVAKNDCFDWFDVSPASGVIEDGMSFTVTFNPKLMTGRRHWRGSFLVRTSAGISRPVSIHAENVEYVPPRRPEVKGFVEYIDAFKPVGGAALKTVDDKFGEGGRMISVDGHFPGAKYEFTVPKDGKYYILVHGYLPGQSFGGESKNPSHRYLRADYTIDGKKSGVFFMFRDYPIWYHTGRMGLQSYDLKAGKHTLLFEKRPGNNFLIDGLCVTDDIEAFDPR